jgi:hypothetical protein
MIIKSKLGKSQFFRLAILYHIQRKSFYFYAITAAIITVVATTQQLYALLVVAWLPFILYLGVGVFGAYRESNNPNNPVLHLTTYRFDDKGVDIESSTGHSQLAWNQFQKWSIVARIYVLTLRSGQILAIPRSAVSAPQVARFRAVLNKHIKK